MFRAVTRCRLLEQTFRRNILFPSSRLKIETVYYFETLLSTYKITRRHNSEQQHRQRERYTNKKDGKRANKLR